MLQIDHNRTSCNLTMKHSTYVAMYVWYVRTIQSTSAGRYGNFHLGIGMKKIPRYTGIS